MVGLDTLGEVGRFGLITAVGVELLTIVIVLVAWKFGLPFNDMKTPFLRIPIRLSEPPRILWDFKRGIRRFRGSPKKGDRKGGQSLS
jgi:hypothetical protein